MRIRLPGLAVEYLRGVRRNRNHEYRKHEELKRTANLAVLMTRT